MIVESLLFFIISKESKMRRLKRFVISAAMAGTEVEVEATAAVVSSVYVMA